MSLVTWYLSMLIFGSSSLSIQVMDSAVASRAIILGGLCLLLGLDSSTPIIGSFPNSESEIKHVFGKHIFSRKPPPSSSEEDIPKF